MARPYVVDCAGYRQALIMLRGKLRLALA